MALALLHPGDLSLWALLLALLLLVGLPTLALAALCFAVYKWLSVKWERRPNIDLEENRGTNAANGSART